MAQQINLIINELKPRRDWLDLRLVLAVGGASALLMGALTLHAKVQQSTAEASRVTVQAEVDRLQQAVVDLSKAIAERKPDSFLVAEIARQREALGLREVALRLVDEGKAGNARGFSALMGGFSRQQMEGVWLTGFDFVDQQIEIRGRLKDYSLLPAYIRKLNSEEVFKSYRFSDLDMKGVEAKSEAPGAAKTPATLRIPYTEFVLRSSDKLKEGSAAPAASTPPIAGAQYKEALLRAENPGAFAAAGKP